jgi:hypothetical protein
MDSLIKRAHKSANYLHGIKVMILSQREEVAVLGTNSCTTSGVHKSRRWGCPGDKMMYGDDSYIGSSVSNLSYITILAPRILRWLIDFWKPFKPCAISCYVILLYRAYTKEWCGFNKTAPFFCVCPVLCIKYNITVYYMFSLRTGRSGNRIPVWGEIFRNRQDRSWGLPILL